MRRRKYRNGKEKLSIFSKEHVYRVKMLVQPNTRRYDWLTDKILHYPFYESETRNIRIKRVKNPDRRSIWWNNEPVYMVTFTTMISNFMFEKLKKDKNIIKMVLLK